MNGKSRENFLRWSSNTLEVKYVTDVSSNTIGLYVYGYSVIGIPIPSANINCYNESYMNYKPNNSYKLVTCSEMVRLLLKYVVKL